MKSFKQFFEDIINESTLVEDASLKASVASHNVNSSVNSNAKGRMWVKSLGKSGGSKSTPIQKEKAMRGRPFKVSANMGADKMKAVDTLVMKGRPKSDLSKLKSKHTD